MLRIVDLSYPIEDHFRWNVQRELAAAFERGDGFQVTRVGFPVHGFTHIDAPRHMLPEGPTTSDFRLESLVGEAAVIDLSGCDENTAISAESIADVGRHVRTGDILVVKTDWDVRFSLSTPDFWTRAPYLTREACEWLAAREPAAVGFDFPQDRPIRSLLDGKRSAMAEFVSHDVILRRGVPLIEYLCNLGSVASARTEICALPLKILEADGAPARVIAIER